MRKYFLIVSLCAIFFVFSVSGLGGNLFDCIVKTPPGDGWTSVVVSNTQAAVNHVGVEVIPHPLDPGGMIARRIPIDVQVFGERWTGWGNISFDVEVTPGEYRIKFRTRYTPLGADVRLRVYDRTSPR